MYQLVIVDDEVTIAEGIANLFPWNQIGFEAKSFSVPERALEYISQNHVDVLMSDIEMPGMDGMELAKEAIKYNTHVVFISSHQNYEYFRAAIQLNVGDYLLKPIKCADVISCFEKIRKNLDARTGSDSPVHRPEKSPRFQIQLDKWPLSPGTPLCEVKAYIEEFFQKASLEEIAVKVNLSASYLSRILKEKCNFSFAEYLLQVRMEKAAEMLRDLQYKSYDIAYYVGYDNPKSFSYAFKNYYGTTPMEYRKGSAIK